jgi:hypothetical protein
MFSCGEIHLSLTMVIGRSLSCDPSAIITVVFVPSTRTPSMVCASEGLRGTVWAGGVLAGDNRFQCRLGRNCFHCGGGSNCGLPGLEGVPLCNMILFIEEVRKTRCRIVNLNDRCVWSVSNSVAARQLRPGPSPVRRSRFFRTSACARCAFRPRELEQWRILLRQCREQLVRRPPCRG